MNLSAPALFFIAATGVYLGIRTVFQRRARSDSKTSDMSSRRDRLLILLVVIGQIVLPLLLVFTPVLDRAGYRTPAAPTWLGAPLMAAAVWLFWRSHADLGDNWSVSLQLNQDHRLVTQGVYRHIRHPMYAAFFAMAIAQGLLLNNWLAGWGALAAVSLLYLLRVPHEEQMMIERFGDEYRTYRQRTGGLMPRL